MNVELPRFALLASLMVAAMPASPTASSPAQQETSHGVSAVVLRNSGTVTGTAWHRNNTPVSHALLRLRNGTDGQIVARTRADAAGRFTFAEVAAGNYIVELVDESGRVLGVGQMFNLGPGETLATFVRLGTDVRWFTGFFNNAAAVAIASAASLGLLAIGDGGQPASARF